MSRIVIGIPHTGTFPWQTTMALLGLQIPKGFTVVYHMIGSCLIYEAREKIIKFAEGQKAKYVLMLDSDMVLPNNALGKMVSQLEADKELGMISGMAFKRTPPFQPCFYTKLTYEFDKHKPYLESPVKFPDKGLMEIQGAGLACVLIRLSSLDEVKRPLFFPLPNLGEDLTFCLKLRIAKVSMVVDLSVDVGHVSSMPIAREHFQAVYDEHQRINPDKQIYTGGTES